MSDVLAQSELGQEIARLHRERGLEQGLVQGMRALLRARFGDLDDLDELARRLADADLEGNIGRIIDGASLAELRS